jgi:SAM-dependent methyltransferase
MDARLQRRIQRYGWDLAAVDYESLWQAQLAEAQAALLALASPAAGEQVLDIACGTGLVSFEAARVVGPSGRVLGIDLSERMIGAAERRRERHAVPRTAAFHAWMPRDWLYRTPASMSSLCALGLMYMPDPGQALREMSRVLRPGRSPMSRRMGRTRESADGPRCFQSWMPRWRARCARCSSGSGSKMPSRICASMRSFRMSGQRRITTTLTFANANEACDAAFVGGPVALAWSRFDG